MCRPSHEPIVAYTNKRARDMTAGRTGQVERERATKGVQRGEGRRELQVVRSAQVDDYYGSLPPSLSPDRDRCTGVSGVRGTYGIERLARSLPLARSPSLCW